MAVEKFEGETLDDFVKWYFDMGMPLRIPKDNFINRLNLATSMIIYREGRFQVQWYLMEPEFEIPEHSHPYVETWVCNWNPKSDHQISAGFEKNTYSYDDMKHGGSGWSFGFEPLFAIQKWDEGVEMTSVVHQWCGVVSCDEHRKLLEDHWGVIVGDNFDPRDHIKVDTNDPI